MNSDTADQENIASFYMHEAMIRVYFDGVHKPLKTTEQIGNIVNITFGKEKDLVPSYTAKALALSLNRAGIKSVVNALSGLVLYNLLEISDDNYKKLRAAPFYVHFKKEDIAIPVSIVEPIRIDNPHSIKPTYTIPLVGLNNSDITGNIVMRESVYDHIIPKAQWARLQNSSNGQQLSADGYGSEGEFDIWINPVTSKGQNANQ